MYNLSFLMNNKIIFQNTSIDWLAYEKHEDTPTEKKLLLSISVQ